MAPVAPVTEATLKAFLEAFNRHDVDAILTFFADDGVVDLPRGPDPWGQRLEGTAAIREGIRMRFSGLPDAHYGEDRHVVHGDRGVSEWLLTGTTPQGQRIRVRGCDLFEFRGGRIARKDSYWKIVE